MKKQPYILIGLTSFLFVAFLFRSIFKVIDLEWTSLFQDLEKTEKVLFLVLMFSAALAFLLVLLWTMVDEISKRRMRKSLWAVSKMAVTLWSCVCIFSLSNLEAC